jgi:metal-responsive CopG/Arc/MetJ family transcriptional regulator
MATARRITISLPEEVLRAADKVALTQESTRSVLVEDALRWYLRIQNSLARKRPPRRSPRSREDGLRSQAVSS